MKEYIERDAAIRTAIQAVVAYSLQITGNGITQFDVVDISERMKMIPVADVAEIGCCKDCINSIDMDGALYCGEWEHNTDEDGYCHLGYAVRGEK